MASLPANPVLSLRDEAVEAAEVIHPLRVGERAEPPACPDSVPAVRVLVLTGVQTGAARSGLASTTTEAPGAQEMRKPKPLVVAPKPGPPLRITGWRSVRSAVGRPREHCIPATTCLLQGGSPA